MKVVQTEFSWQSIIVKKQFRKWLTSLTASDENLSEMARILSSQGPWAQISLSPHIAGAPKITVALRLPGTLPSDYWSPSYCWGPSNCQRPIRLLGPSDWWGPQFSKSPSADCWGPSDCWRPLRLQGLLDIAQPAQPIAISTDYHLNKKEKKQKHDKKGKSNVQDCSSQSFFLFIIIYLFIYLL